jgi:aspartate ammonia-lyase
MNSIKDSTSKFIPIIRNCIGYVIKMNSDYVVRVLQQGADTSFKMPLDEVHSVILLEIIESCECILNADWHGDP